MNLLRIIPREYIDSLMEAKTKEFDFNANVKTDKGTVRASVYSLKGKRLMFVDDPIYKGLSASYSKFINRIAKVKGVYTKFKVFIIPTDAEEEISTPFGKLKVVLAIAEVYRETDSGRRRIFHYGTVVAGRKFAVFNPFGVITEEGLNSVISGKAFSDFKPKNENVACFVVSKVLDGKGFGSYFNFPAVFYGESKTGYIMARLNGNRITFQESVSGLNNVVDTASVNTITYTKDERMNKKTPQGHEVFHYNTIITSGSVSVARFYISKKNPDVVWLGKLASSLFRRPELPVRIVNEPEFIINSVKIFREKMKRKGWRSGVTYTVFELKSDEHGFTTELPDEESIKGTTYFKVKGLDPISYDFEIINARAPSIILYNGDTFNAGVIFTTVKKGYGYGVAKGIVVITSKDERILTRTISVEGELYVH